MAIVIACPHCKTKIQVPPQHRGKQVGCPKCKGAFVVPQLATAPPVATSPIISPSIKKSPKAPVSCDTSWNDPFSFLNDPSLQGPTSSTKKNTKHVAIPPEIGELLTGLLLILVGLLLILIKKIIQFSISIVKGVAVHLLEDWTKPTCCDWCGRYLQGWYHTTHGYFCSRKCSIEAKEYYD